MASPPLFRFIHASRLELDRFCSVTGDSSSDQSRLLVDAPFRAAERVFEAALREEARLIVLAGGLFVGRNPATWGASFLARQCERVGRQGVQVVWIDADHESARNWPGFLARPKNLHVLKADSPAPLRLTLGSSLSVEIGCAAAADLLLRKTQPLGMDAAPPFRIGALTHVPAEPQRLDRPIDYWAVCSGEAPESFATMHGMARSSGTIQPRHADTVAAGGCLMVEVGPGYSLGTRFIETGSLRYHVERIETDDSTNWEGFRRRVHARTEEITQATVADAVAFHWQVQGHGPVIDRLVRPGDADELAAELRAAFGARTPSAWLLPIVPTPDAVQESRWQRDRSTFGTFVRSLDALAPGAQGDVDLARLNAEVLRSIDPAARHVPRPHYQTSLKANARRHAAQLLTRLSR
jgi:hypothetical protein